MKCFGTLGRTLTALSCLLLIIVGAAAQNERRLDVKMRSGTALDGRGQLWAVVIGVSRYKNLSPDEQLRFAHRDAEAFAAFLRTPSGGGFPSTHIKLLLNDGATLSEMRTALGTWLPRSAEPDDVVYIFFAGHGVVEGEADGYLLAHDSDPQNLYATALQIGELDRIIRERLRARVVVLMADACHAGKLGWTSRGAEAEVLINRYLDEIGKTGSGVFRLLASRADERSFEDTRWGGGHGAFTYYLLEGLKGKADRDSDSVVRAAELLEYLSEVVPEATRALQHPRAAGNIDARLPLATLAAPVATTAAGTPTASPSGELEVRGLPGSEVYIDNSFRGRIRPNGVLLIDGLRTGRIELSVDPPGGEPFTQLVNIASSRTVLDLAPGAATSVAAGPRPSALAPRIRQSLEKGLVLDQGGAWSLYQQMLRESPQDPNRNSLEVALSSSLAEIGQQAINDYVHSSVSQLRRDAFHRGAIAFTYLQSLGSSDDRIDAKRLFCTGRALIVEGKSKEAIEALEQAVRADPKAAYSHNALGVAYEKIGKNGKAVDCFRRAASLAPKWVLPRLHLGIQYLSDNKLNDAARELRAVVDMDPRNAFARLLLARAYRQSGSEDEAFEEASKLAGMAPNYPAVYLELGLLYEARRDFDRATAAYERFLQLDPKSPDAPAVRDRAAQTRRKSGRNPSLRRP